MVIWLLRLSTRFIYQLNVPQKIVGQAIIEAFHTVASVIVELEAGLELPLIRHHKQQLQSWFRWHTKSLKHRFWKILSALNLASSQVIAPPQKLAIKFQPLEDLSILEKFESYIQPPWLPNISCNIPLQPKAILVAQNVMGPVIFTDSSV